MNQIKVVRADRVLLVMLITALAMWAHRGEAFPEPDLVSDAWQFDFEHEAPRRIVVRLPGEKQATIYWYLPYTVTNNTGEDRLFIPSFTVLTDAGDLITAGEKIDPLVYEAIEQQEKNPLLESPIEVIGKLLQGEDNARDSVAIWPAPASDVDRMTIFVGGISGETAVVTNPRTDEQVVLRKTLALTYDTPGDPGHLMTTPVIPAGEEWVMR